MEVVDGGQTKRGVKRHADESSLSDDQRFAKRFNRLSLATHALTNSHTCIPAQAPHDVTTLTTSFDDGMQIDDTKDRVYIGDLDAEIAEIEAHEPSERLVFLSDIEKQFSRIPHHILVGERTNAASQQLVLYDVPKSLTVDPDHDSVRKAILEARHRAQTRAAEEAEARYGGVKSASSNHRQSGDAQADATEHYVEQDYDSDTMDIE